MLTSLASKFCFCSKALPKTSPFSSKHFPFPCLNSKRRMVCTQQGWSNYYSFFYVGDITNKSCLLPRGQHKISRHVHLKFQLCQFLIIFYYLLQKILPQHYRSYLLFGRHFFCGSTVKMGAEPPRFAGSKSHTVWRTHTHTCNSV